MYGAMYEVLIIEDDPMVASINRQYVEMDAAFRVAQVCRDGGEGLAYLSGHRVDLIILDYYTPGLSCPAFMARLHALEGEIPAVIMVTSNNDTRTVQKLFSQGVLDYLVKPFQYRRFHEALSRFHAARQRLRGVPESVNQADIDQMLHGREQPPISEPLPKGLNAATLRHVRDFLAAHRAERFTCEQLAEPLGLSRITVRRYVTYMAQAGEVSSSIDYQTGGRPAVRYFAT